MGLRFPDAAYRSHIQNVVMAPEIIDQELLDSIRHACWWVRHYHGCRNPLKLSQALLNLGLTCREAFNKSNDFPSLLRAVYDGLSPGDAPPF